MGFRKIGGGIVRNVVGMRVIKTDNILAAASRQLQCGDHLLWIDAVCALRRVQPHVLAWNRERHSAIAIGSLAQQDSAALLRIAALGFPADQVVVGFADSQHVQL